MTKTKYFDDKNSKIQEFKDLMMMTNTHFQTTAAINCYRLGIDNDNGEEKIEWRKPKKKTENEDDVDDDNYDDNDDDNDGGDNYGGMNVKQKKTENEDEEECNY